jgi:acyl-CoA oxidase
MSIMLMLEGGQAAVVRHLAWQVRYAAVRRQTAPHAGEREVQVLDYQNTAADLLPLLAASYALIFMVVPPPPADGFLLHNPVLL